MKHFLILCLLAGWMLWSAGTSPAAGFQPGFRTIGAWSEPTQRMEINLWYPCRRSPHELNYSPWLLSGSLNAKPAEGVFPLVVLSHPTPGNRFSYHSLAASLARHGYIVAAPTHLRDSMHNMDDMFNWSQLARRLAEIEATVNLVRAEKEFAQSIGKIGILGFGAGGTAGLIMCGAEPNCQSWPSYCQKAHAGDPYCTKKARSRIAKMCEELPGTPARPETTFAALACIAPAYGMLFDNASFERFQTPIMIVGAGRDAFGRSELHSERLARYLGKRALYLDLPQADVGALMAECPPQLAEELPELCKSVSRETRTTLYTTLENALLTFFDKNLR